MKAIAENGQFADRNRRLRDRIVMGIRDIRVRVRILRKADPDLPRVMEIIRSTEMAQRQTKEMSRENHETNALQSRDRRSNFKKPTNKSEEKPRRRGSRQVKVQVNRPTSGKCKFCARIHEYGKEKCPAWEKGCTLCNKRNHFSRCSKSKEDARAVNHDSEEEYEEICTVTGSGPRKIMKELELWDSTKTVAWQVDTGATCNVLPFKEYVRVTGDQNEEHLDPGYIRIDAYGGARI